MKLFRFIGEKPVSLFKTKNKQKRAGIIIGASLLVGAFFCCQSNLFAIAWAKDKTAEESSAADELKQGDAKTSSGAAGLCESLEKISGEVNENMRQLCQKNTFEVASEEEKRARDLEQRERMEQAAFEKKVDEILQGTPMEQMTESIVEQEKIVAAFLVGIALKESSFGQHAPHKGGRDCYNYWGYKGGHNPTKGGYSCFASPEQAVQVVGKRLHKLAIAQNRNTPGKMIVWKCGRSCAGHSSAGVAKWISDVSINFNKINNS